MNRFASMLIGAVPARLLEFVSHNQWRSPLLRRVCSWGASRIKGRDGIILKGAGQGLRFNVAGSHSGFLLGSHETEVQQVLAEVLRPGMVYYDVGANVGFFAVIASRMVGQAGRVVCFEPLPANARQIEYNAQLNSFTNIENHVNALGGSNRTEVFQTSAEPTWGMLAAVGKAPGKASGQIEVSVRTLDSLCATGALPHPNLIKIDVEGAEAEMLQGAAATLSESRPLLVIELHSTNDAVLAVLDKLGYNAAVIGSPVSVRDVDWDANIIAAPREEPKLLEMVSRFSKGSVAA